MVHLTETERINDAQVKTPFNEIQLEREPISKSTVSKTQRRFNETGSVKKCPKPGRPKTAANHENALNVLLDATENPKSL